MPKSRDYMFGDKRELSSVAEQGPTSRAFYDALMADEFKPFIGSSPAKTFSWIRRSTEEGSTGAAMAASWIPTSTSTCTRYIRTGCGR